MHVGIHAAWQHEHAVRVDLGCGAHLAADLDDPATGDAEVSICRFGGRHHPPAAHDQIEFSHRAHLNALQGCI